MSFALYTTSPASWLGSIPRRVPSTKPSVLLESANGKQYIISWLPVTAVDRDFEGRSVRSWDGWRDFYSAGGANYSTSASCQDWLPYRRYPLKKTNKCTIYFTFTVLIRKLAFEFGMLLLPFGTNCAKLKLGLITWKFISHDVCDSNKRTCKCTVY